MQTREQMCFDRDGECIKNPLMEIQVDIVYCDDLTTNAFPI